MSSLHFLLRSITDGKYDLTCVLVDLNSFPNGKTAGFFDAETAAISDRYRCAATLTGKRWVGIGHSTAHMEQCKTDPCKSLHERRGNAKPAAQDGHEGIEANKAIYK